MSTFLKIAQLVQKLKCEPTDSTEISLVHFFVYRKEIKRNIILFLQPRNHSLPRGKL